MAALHLILGISLSIFAALPSCASVTIRAAEFLIFVDKVCTVQNNTENTESCSVHECSVKCMAGANCVGFNYQDGRCSFVSADVVDLTMSVQTGAKCVLIQAGLKIFWN